MKTHATREKGPGSTPAHAGERSQGKTVRPLSTADPMETSPVVAAQRRLQRFVDGSPRQAAQASRLTGMSPNNRAIQRMGGEEEEMLQAKGMPLQRVEAPEEEEPLQGRGLPVQRAGVEEEEMLQATGLPLQRAEAPEEEEPLQGRGLPIQPAGAEEEEMLQAKGLPLQRAEAPEEEEPLQGKGLPVQRAGAEEEDMLQAKGLPPQAGPGLPEPIRAGIRDLSGMDMDDVRVHYNSTRPAGMNALAYAQGKDIHLGPGQEKHLPHEAWHLVQQAQGRVRPTAQLRNGVTVNDDPQLETEADRMGARAATQRMAASPGQKSSKPPQENVQAITQRKILLNGKPVDLAKLLEMEQDEHGRLILANWGWSPAQHDFRGNDDPSALEALRKALAGARQQPDKPPSLYCAANLSFLTKDDERLPTLYFINGNQSGRIRQQHGSGPAVIAQTGKVDYFFASRKAMGEYHHLAKQAMRAGTPFNIDVTKHNGTLTPTSGFYHLEVTYVGDKVAKIHPSGGQVDLAMEAYDDARIQKIYAKAIGRST